MRVLNGGDQAGPSTVSSRGRQPDLGGGSVPLSLPLWPKGTLPALEEILPEGVDFLSVSKPPWALEPLLSLLGVRTPQVFVRPVLHTVTPHPWGREKPGDSRTAACVGAFGKEDN